jgi:hypothetical protein
MVVSFFKIGSDIAFDASRIQTISQQDSQFAIVLNDQRSHTSPDFWLGMSLYKGNLTES